MPRTPVGARRARGGRRPPRDEAYLDDDGTASAPEEVEEIIEAGNEIATKPYKYGGRHRRWIESGRGGWITVRSNPSHADLVVAGLRFDTRARKQSGNRWSEQTRSARGYGARHTEAL